MHTPAIAQNDLKLATFACAAIALVWVFTAEPLVPVALAAAPLVILFAVRKPFQLCLIFIAFSFFRLHEAYPFLYSFKIPLIFGALSFFALAWHVFIQRSIVPVWPTELKWFTALFVLTTLGVVIANNKQLAFEYWTDVFLKIGIMTFAIAWLMRGASEISQANRMIVISSALVSLVAIYNRIFDIGLVAGNRVTVGRDLDSMLGDPNDLALALLLPLAFAIMSAVYKTGTLNRVLGLITAPAILWCIIATQSRGGVIGVIVVLAVIFLRTVKSKVLVVALAIAVVLALALTSNITSRPDLGQSADIDDSALDRLYAWQAALNMALARPLFGVGLSNFADSMFMYSERWSNYRDMVAHSTWLTVLAETGFPGFTAFLAMIISMFTSIRRSIAKLAKADAPPIAQAMAVALLASLGGFCAAGTFLTQAFTWQIYILLGLTVAIGRYADEATAASPLVRRYHESNGSKFSLKSAPQ